MRAIALVATLIAACGSTPAPPDGAAPDSTPPVGDSFRVPVGAACDVSQTTLCAFGVGVCFESVCRQQCSSPPTCPEGTMQHVVVAGDGGNTCVCVPE